jgi:hypothetical protein
MSPSTRRWSCVSASVSLSALVLSVYWRTLSPGVAGGDTGELLAESCQLGTAHPPGYPLFTLLNHAVMQWTSMIPGLDSWGMTPAARANAFAALLSAACAGVTVSTSCELTAMRRPPALPGDAFALLSSSLAAGGLLAFSPLIWQYAVTAEVFALNNLFAACLVRLTVWFAQKPTWWRATVGAFVCGLALTNQHTIVLFVFPIALWVLATLTWSEKKNEAQKSSPTSFLAGLAAVGVAFVAGLSPYLYLVAVGRFSPKAGSWGDLSTLPGLLHHMRRADYGTFRLYSGRLTGDSSAIEDLSKRIMLWAQDLSLRQGVVGAVPVLSLLGALWLLLQRSRPPSQTCSAVLCSALLFYLLVFHFLSNMPLDDQLLFGVHARFWQQPNVLLFAFAGPGLYAIFRRAPTLCAAISAGLVAWQASASFSAADQSGATYFSDYAAAKLSSLPPHTVLLINNDQVWTSTRYLQLCEGFRQDVTLLNMSMMTFTWFSSQRRLLPDLHFPGTHYGAAAAAIAAKGGGKEERPFDIAELVDANYSRRPFFMEGSPNYADHYLVQRYDLVPEGLSFRIRSRRDVQSLEDWMISSGEAWGKVEMYLPRRGLPPPDKYTAEWWESTLRIIYVTHLAQSCAYAIERAIAVAEADRTPKEIAAMLYGAVLGETALTWGAEDGDSPAAASLLKNLGIAYMNMVRSATVMRLENLPRLPNGGSSDLLPWGLNGSSWKDRASSRFLEMWGSFLQHPDAKDDPDYGRISEIYNLISSKTSRTASPS